WIAGIPETLAFWAQASGHEFGSRSFWNQYQIPVLGITALVAMGMLVIVLWRFSLPAARRIWRALPPIAVSLEVSLSDLKIVAYMTLGVWVVVSAIPRLAAIFVAVNHHALQSSAQSMSPPNFTQKIVVAVIQIVVGLILFFNAATIARRAGAPKRRRWQR
ncbi:MAG TPA: hypothetical protein VKA63_12150, partial [Candidatus Krumholzibacteria bacterium]|nr:hypothetical protein [Candidatus Krumholzibacteria bacterium]